MKRNSSETSRLQTKVHIHCHHFQYLWWIAFVIWLTDERCLVLFPFCLILFLFPLSVFLTIANLRLAVERIGACAKTEFRLSRINLCSCDNHYTTAPLRFIISHCIKNNIFVKTLNVHIFSWFSAICGSIIFSVKQKLKKYHIFCKTKIKENTIFSMISGIFRNKSLGQDFDNKKLIKW